MICASIKVKFMKDAIDMLAQVPDDYDLVEIWINELDDLNFPSIKEAATKPVIIKITDFTDKNLLKEVIENGFEYVDVDIEDFGKLAEFHPTKTKKIASFHNFEDTCSLEEAKAMVQRMKTAGADVAKFVCMAKECTDNLVMLNLLKEVKNTPLIAFCMGELGRMSRVLGPQCGSYISFIPPDSGWKTADGQILYAEWKMIKEVLFKK